MKAVVAGHVCVDLVPGLLEALPPSTVAFRPGSIVSASGLGTSLGGVVGNTGVAMSVLGGDVTLMGKVGDDPLGHEVVRMLSGHRAAQVVARVPGDRTSYSVVLAPPGRDRTIIHDPGANDTFGPEDLQYDAVAEAGVFHFGYPPVMKRMYADGGSQLEELLRRVKALGVTTSLDFCVPDPGGPSAGVDWEALVRRVLPFVDIMAPSIEEALAMLEPAAPAEPAPDTQPLEVLGRLAEKLLAWSAKVVVIKCGAAGAYLRTAGVRALAQGGQALEPLSESWQETELFHPAFHVRSVVNTTGAGDAFIAGLLSGVCAGESPQNALELACATGALSTQSTDACGALLRRDCILQRIAEGWVVNPAPVMPEEWEPGPGRAWHNGRVPTMEAAV